MAKGARRRARGVYFSFPANAGSLFFAGQVVRQNVCLPRHSFLTAVASAKVVSDGWCGSRDPACPAIALATAEEKLKGNGWLNIKNFDIRNSLFDIRYLHATEVVDSAFIRCLSGGVAGFSFDLVENRGHLRPTKY